MENINKLVEQITQLNTNDFDKLRPKYFNIIKLRQEQKFNNKFPNLELNNYSMAKYIRDTRYYYKFSSQAHFYEFELIISNAKAKKYSFLFFVDGESEFDSAKIPEKNIIKNDRLDIAQYICSIGDNDSHEVDITLDELQNVVNYLFFNKKFVHNV